MNKDKFLTSVALRRLLFSLMDLRPDIGIRFRLIGQMWQGDYSRIVKITGKGGLFSDEKTSRMYGIQNLDNVVQFEIDQRFQEFEPHFHYSILPVAVLWRVWQTCNNWALEWLFIIVNDDKYTQLVRIRYLAGT